MTSEARDQGRSIPAGWLMQHVVNPITVLIGGPSLEVPGRRTGRLIRTPIPPFEFEGQRYLVSGHGQAHWVRNLRAAGRGVLRRGGRHDPFRAVELAGAERDQVLAAYRARLGRRVARLFSTLPDPADHPVFRMDSTSEDPSVGA